MTSSDRLDLLAERIRLAEEKERRLALDRRALFRPNAKQWEFCSSQATETFLTGPNQYGGKTYTLRYLIATHATGDYPPEWAGPRYDDPPVILVLSKSRDANRDQIIHHLFSEVYEMEITNGPGWIRPDEYDTDDLHNMSRSLISARVKHKGPDGQINGKSILFFLSYDMGWRRIAGYTADLTIGNETPPMPLYTEMKARINVGTKRGGRPRLYIGACPLEEDPEVFFHFRDSNDGKHMKLIDYTIDDCTHLTEAEYDDAIARWGAHPEAEARLYGRPCRAGGLVFPYQRQDITVPPEKPDPALRHLIGLDLPLVGGHFAAVAIAWDESTDSVVVYDEFKSHGQERAVYAQRVRIMGGDRIPCAWPHDGNIRSEASAPETRAEAYRDLGLNMLRDHAFFYDGSKKSRSKMAMIAEAQTRLATGRLKVSQTCGQLLAEMQSYRHKNGKIPERQDDHLIDALLKALMMLRYSKPLHVLSSPFERRDEREATLFRKEYDFFDM